MSNPRVKRPFAGAASDPSQRQITTFFTSTRPAQTPAQKQQTQYPVLPSTVQSDLLSVGMRIRKSVPEGYKTGSSHSAFRLWDERAAPVRSRRGGAGAGELVPFCGVNRIGGYGVQPAQPYEDIEEDDEYDDMPGLTSSQDTVGSVEFENSRKRGFEENDEEEGLAILGARVVGAGNGGNRIIAVPKGRRKGVGQENVRMAADFEEADFLDERVFAGDFSMSDA